MFNQFKVYDSVALKTTIILCQNIFITHIDTQTHEAVTAHFPLTRALATTNLPSVSIDLSTC